MNIMQIVTFGFEVYKRFSKQKISKSTYHSVAGAFRYGCSESEWLILGRQLGIVEPE